VEAAEAVATNYGGTLDAEEIRAIVRAFRDESEKIMGRDMDAAITEALDGAVPISEEEWTAAVAALAEPQEPEEEGIPAGIMASLVAFANGPVVVLAASGGGRVLTTKAAGHGGDAELVVRMLTMARDAIDSPLAETGGVTADGAIVAPMKRGRE
jgi:hypothetical protein